MLKIVVALFCEAKPLIEALKLKKTNSSLFPVYENDQVELIISGLGMINASAAVMHLHHVSKNNQGTWLNIGLCGHPNAEVGKALLASKISHFNLNKHFYPYLPLKHSFSLSPLITLDKPSQNYIEDTLYDMEAFGFFNSAIKVSSIEKIHSLKIVSDNFQSEDLNISKEKASALIEKNLFNIDVLMKLLKKLDQKQAPYPYLQEVLNQFSFTETEKHKVIQNLNLLFAHNQLNSPIETNSKKEFLNSLKNKIYNLPLKTYD